jgi:hypothetical protein
MKPRTSTSLLLLVYMAISSGAQDMRVLQLASEKSLQATTIPSSGFVQSDEDSNLYLHVDRGSYNDGTILKVSRKDSSTTMYAMPENLKKFAYFVEFYVTRDGKLNVLYKDGQERLFIVSYEAKGTAKDPTYLEMPLHVRVRDFAVFESGEFLTSGFFDAKASKELSGKSNVALFDRTGKLLKNFGNLTGGVDLGQVFTRVNEGMAASGEDGNIYLLHSAEVFVISSSGEIARTIKFQKAGKDFMPLQLFVSGGQLAIVQHQARDGDINKIVVQLLDSQTGEPIALYTPEDKLGNMIVNFSRRDGFSFIDGGSGTLKLMTANAN